MSGPEGGRVLFGRERCVPCGESANMAEKNTDHRAHLEVLKSSLEDGQFGLLPAQGHTL